MPKTKIVCTIGSIEDDRKINGLVENGMDVARLNGSYYFNEEENFKKRIELIRKADDSIPILLDLPGPKIRTKMHKEVKLEKGDKVGFFYGKHENSSDIYKIEVTGPLVHAEVGDSILVDDGNLEFEIIEINNNLVIARILNEGTIIHGKGINFPTKDLEGDYLNQKDKILINFAKESGIDFVGASFVRNKEDVLKLRELLEDSSVKIISKIETKAAVKNMEEIIKESDGIMIDRGDLSAETDMKHIPFLQKNIIKSANKLGKPTIIATELLHTMTNTTKPTKAEISDIANAVLDGASALMLSGETAVGSYPIESLDTMKSIIDKTEELLDYKHFDYQLNTKEISNAVSKSIYNLSNQLEINKILCFTKNGFSPKMISRFKLRIPVIAITDSKAVQRELNLVWGISPVYIEGLDEDLKKSMQYLLEHNKVKKEDLVIITEAEKTKDEISVDSISIKKISKLIQ